MALGILIRLHEERRACLAEITLARQLEDLWFPAIEMLSLPGQAVYRARNGGELAALRAFDNGSFITLWRRELAALWVSREQE